MITRENFFTPTINKYTFFGILASNPLQFFGQHCFHFLVVAIEIKCSVEKQTLAVSILVAFLE